MTFSDSFLQEIVDHNDIESVVSEYVHFAKTSGRNKFASCPFHSEKTPSFSVSKDKQIYYCFGCGKGGGVINFIMSIENLSFVDAVVLLAKRAGLQLPAESASPDSSRRERMLSLNNAANRFFRERFFSGSGAERVQNYAKNRGISPEMLDTFGIGFAPDAWDNLIKSMLKLGYSELELVSAGLAKKRGNGSMYDAFRNRLMFPVIDVRGSIIGFSGRILGDGEPKYLNSPDTLLYSKSHNLFALNLAKKSKFGYIILSEGNIDVVSLHQAGFDNAVATLGTALTPEQARLIARYKQEIVIAYDNDTAGKKAAARAITILEKLELRVRVLSLSGAKDPDEYIRQKGADSFKNLLDSSKNHIEFRLGALSAQFDTSTDEGRLQYLHGATELLSELQNPLEREIYCGKIAETAGIGRDAVFQESERLRKKQSGIDKKRRDREIMPTRIVQPPERSLRFENSAISGAETGVIRLILHDPQRFSSDTGLTASDFSNTFLGAMFEKLHERVITGESLSIDALSQIFSTDEISLLIRLSQEPVSYDRSEDELTDYIKKIRSNNMIRAEKVDINAFALMRRNDKGYGG